MSTARTVQATILNTATLSNAIDIGEGVVCGLLLPATFTGTTVKFQGSNDPAGTYQIITDKSGSDYTVTVAQGKNNTIPITDLTGWRFLKLQVTAQNQDSVVQVMVRSWDR